MVLLFLGDVHRLKMGTSPNLSPGTPRPDRYRWLEYTSHRKGHPTDAYRSFSSPVSKASYSSLKIELKLNIQYCIVVSLNSLHPEL